MDCLSTILRKELVQHLQALLRGVSPQDGAERLDRLRALPVIGSGGDVRHVRAQALDDLVRVLELLGREVAVVEDPVILLPVLVLAPQDVHRRVQECEHLVAPFDALCIIIQL